MTDNSRYTRMGYRNRTHYLDSLADDYGISPAAVRIFSDLLGPEEDFDALIIELEENWQELEQI